MGKEAAERLLSKEINPSGFKTIEGDDLQVGGAGMKGYYDEILPQTMNDLLKQLGVKERVKPIYMDRELMSPSANTSYEIVDSNGQLWNTVRHPEDAQKFIDQQMSNPNFLQKGLDLSVRPIEPKYKYTNPQMGIELTPELKEILFSEGLPHFHDGGNVQYKPVNLNEEFKKSRYGV